MKVRVLVIAFAVALLVGLGVAYAKPQSGVSLPVVVENSLILVSGPAVNQANWFCATQEQGITQLTLGLNTVSGSGGGGSLGNGAQLVQGQSVAAGNYNQSNMYTGPAIGDFNRPLRGKVK